MAMSASKLLFLFLLSILLAPFSEASFFKDFGHRKLTREQQTFYYEAIQHDLVYPSTPVSVSLTTDNSAPTVITVPATNPANLNPPPYSTPLTVPSTSPVPVTNTNPVTPPPSSKPEGQPVSNPVTTYPAPTGGGVPATNPVTPPATTNAPPTSGKSWCVAKPGAQQSAVQAALDYACGIGKADCSAIQQGASCYNPNTLQNHASYAFNNYYQKNPVPTGCDFGGSAMLTSANPSTGSCVFPTSSSSSSAPTIASPTPPTPTTPTPTTPTPTTPTPAMPSPVSTTPTIATPYGTPPSTSTPPSVLNSSSPGLGGFPTSFGDSPPPFINTSTSTSSSLQPFTWCITLLAFMITGKLILDLQDSAFRIN